ncbi:MAG: fibronectin type III domain-containing protein, partial [Acidimicrobiia bacterium]|nr:fibronectin type III domain-containing protein [Acidimicrobiia bacterium]
AQPAEPAGDDADHHRALLSAFETQRRSDEVAPTDIAVDELEARVASDTEPQERASCYEATFNDTQFDTTWLDIAIYAGEYTCSSWLFAAGTRDSWLAFEMDGFIVEIDTDTNGGSGCDGSDYAIVGIYDGGLDAGVLRTPTCNSDGWTFAGPASISKSFADTIGIGAAASVIGNPGRLRWRMALLSIYGDIDLAPNFGSHLAAPAPPVTAPSAPRNLRGASGHRQVALSWTQPADNGGAPIRDYRVQYSAGGSWITYDDGVSANTQAVVRPLSNGTTHRFRVAAKNGQSGWGPWSSTITATPQAVPRPYNKVFYGIETRDPDNSPNLITVSRPYRRYGRSNIVSVIYVDYGASPCAQGGRRHPGVVRYWARSRALSPTVSQLQSVTQPVLDCMNPDRSVFFLDPMRMNYDSSVDQLRITRAQGGPVRLQRICDGRRSGPLPVVLGTNGNDRLIGRARSEIFDGRGGNDTIKGAKGNDIICTGAGHDNAHAGNGFDVVLGQDGIDALTGAEGNDIVIGDASGLGTNQTSKGGRGSDILIGGLDGDDRLFGQQGHDRLISLGSSGRIRFDGGPGFDVCAAGGSRNIARFDCERFFP